MDRPLDPFPPLSTKMRVAAKFSVDLLLWTLAGVVAFLLRSPAQWPSVGVMASYLAIGVLIKTAVIVLAKLDRQSWQQVAVPDLLAVTRAICAGTAVLFGLGMLIHGADTGFPRTAPLIEGIVAVLFLGSARFFVRGMVERHARRSPGGPEERRVLLVGAGRAGAQLVRDLEHHPHARIRPIGFLDDDRGKRRLVIGQIPVIGVVNDLPQVVAERAVNEVFITMPTAPGDQVRRVFDLSSTAGVPCRILPAITEILAGDVDMYRLRDVQVEDLLQRPPVELTLDPSSNYLDGNTVLVTGAGGSIGAEIVRQLSLLSPRRVILFDHDENALHALENQLGREHPDLERTLVVGTVRDRPKLDLLMQTFHPEVIFHTAAHKHVPLLELAADEAILNNVGGTLNVAQAAAAAGVRWLVHTSSDKAVDPVSVLGVTKLLAEQVVAAVAQRAGEQATYVSVRFGNVLGSQGSVVSVFQDQIARGGPITITHPEMTRYFMTIPEASRLVMQVGAIGRNGGVYFLEMGTPVAVRQLAQDMIMMAGADPGEIQLTYTGLRPGERLTEKLHAREERTDPTGQEGITMIGSDQVPGGEFLPLIDELLDVATRRDWLGVASHLEKLHPGFTPPASPFDLR